jgi:hypothetical protein
MERTRGERVEPIVCRSYTFARRYPLVIGKISGWAPFWGPATPTQYAIGVGGALLMIWGRRFWGPFLPGPIGLFAIIGVPLALAWAVRSARFEHRAPLRALLGLLTLVTTPPRGRVNGHAYFEPRTHPLGGTRIFVSELPARRPRRRRKG